MRVYGGELATFLGVCEHLKDLLDALETLVLCEMPAFLSGVLEHLFAI